MKMSSRPISTSRDNMHHDFEKNPMKLASDSVLCVTYVNLRALREFARVRLPRDSPLREVILAEDEKIPAANFLVKLQVWLMLLNRNEDKTTSQ